jgi:ectoine hydroxylase
VPQAQARLDDLYPSRVGGKAALLPRKDPVVVPGGTGPLDAEALERFSRDGFLVVESLLSEERVAALLAEVERRNVETAAPPGPELVREPASGDLRSIFRVHRDPGPFARLAREPRIVAMAEQILGGAVYLHQSRVNRKPGFAGKDFFWHSDFETWHVEDGMPRMRAISVSVALTPNHSWNAPLLLIPGSHQHYVSCPGHTPPNHYEQSLQKQEYGTPSHEALRWLAGRGGIASITCDTGAAVLFDCNTMHGSNGNITPDPRTNVFLVYNSVENALEAPFGGMPPRPEFLAARRVEPLSHDAEH